MDRFLSSATNRIDAKGRVSVPAPFRAALAKRHLANKLIVMKPGDSRSF